MKKKWALITLTAIAVLCLQGCAKPVKQKEEAVFFPPAPNPPRIQFLTGISNSVDVEGKKDDFSLFVFGKQEKDKVKKIHKPYGLKVHKNKIYLCDLSASRVIVIDLAEKTFEYLKGNYSIGKLKKPVNLTLDAQGNLYVADIDRKEVVIYSPEGDFLAAYGRELNMKPSDVAVDDKFIYVLDLTGNEIKVLDRERGKYVRSIGKRTEETEGLALPTNLSIGEDGLLYVTNAGSGKIMKLDRDGHILGSFGEIGDGFGMFARPKGVDIDDRGRIYIVDGGHQNVQIFNAEERLLIFFGDPGLPRGSMNLPAGVAVSNESLEFFKKFVHPSFDVDYLIFVTNQYGDDKIGVYALGRMRGVTYPEDGEGRN